MHIYMISANLLLTHTHTHTDNHTDATGRAQGNTRSQIVLPTAYRAALLRKMEATGLPLAAAAGSFFRGRDFFGQLEGRPEDLAPIRATLASSDFFGFSPARS